MKNLIICECAQDCALRPTCRHAQPHSFHGAACTMVTLCTYPGSSYRFKAMRCVPYLDRVNMPKECDE